MSRAMDFKTHSVCNNLDGYSFGWGLIAQAADDLLKGDKIRPRKMLFCCFLSKCYFYKENIRSTR